MWSCMACNCKHASVLPFTSPSTSRLIVTQAHIAAHIIQVPDLRFVLTMDVKPQHICDFLAFPAFKLSRTRRVSMTRRQKSRQQEKCTSCRQDSCQGGAWWKSWCRHSGACSRLTTCRLPRQPTLLTDMHFFKGVEVTRSAKKSHKGHQKVL